MTGVIQSYGAGIQSRAMLHLSLNNQLTRPDRVIFADTQAEPQAVYHAVEEDQEHCRNAGIPFDTVTHGDLSATDQWGGVFIPAHTLNPSTGSKGMLRRQCTQRFKVQPIRKHLRALGYTQATMRLGITTDESIRMRDSNVQWITHSYPLIDMDWNRNDCDNYLRTLGLAAVKSACVFCPYRSNYGWAKIRANPGDWKAAIAYDEQLRQKRPQGGDLFVHPDRVPLREAQVPDLASMIPLFDDHGGFGNECEGHCGV